MSVELGIDDGVWQVRWYECKTQELRDRNEICIIIHGKLIRKVLRYEQRSLLLFWDSFYFSRFIEKIEALVFFVFQAKLYYAGC